MEPDKYSIFKTLGKSTVVRDGVEMIEMYDNIELFYYHDAKKLSLLRKLDNICVVYREGNFQEIYSLDFYLRVIKIENGKFFVESSREDIDPKELDFQHMRLL
jgi:hypothetical protein